MNADLTPLLGSLVGSIGWALIHFIWQGTLLGFATAIALLLMRKACPEHRYVVACAALLACVLLPAFNIWHGLHGDDAASSGTVFNDVNAAIAASGDAVNLLDALQAHMDWIVGFWALCAALLSLRFALGLAWIGKVQTHGKQDAHWQVHVGNMAERFGITRTIKLVVVEHLESPLTAGWWRPVVLVPAALFAGMPPDLLEALLAHELAHIKRHDYVVNLAQNLVETFLFYHPAVWWMSRQIRALREQIADDYAARQLGEPRRLALALSELERIQFSTQHLAQAANGGDLMTRIKRLVRPETQAMNWKAAIPVLGLAFACVTLYAHAGSSTSAAAPVPAASQASAPAAAMAPTAASDTANNPEAKIADLNSCAPDYPAESLAKKQSGDVYLSFVISNKGKLVSSKVDKSSGFSLLDEAARSGLSKCKFRAAVKNGKAIQATLKAEYVWKLPD